MPTCWNGNPGITNNHIDHMAYTTDGTVAGPCPTGYERRVPQIQLFVRISPYRGADVDYILSDEGDVFHVDFMNGWQEGKLQEVIDHCPIEGDRESGYNPPCDCEQFLTPNNNEAERAVCDDEVKYLILNEDTDVVSTLPRGSCEGSSIVPKSWDVNPPFRLDDKCQKSEEVSINSSSNSIASSVSLSSPSLESNEQSILTVSDTKRPNISTKAPKTILP